MTFNELNDYQNRLAIWTNWNNQSSEYKLNHPQPTPPDKENK